ncbi:hypothetical protein MP638_000604, partial [Amoeboaphelidium occidentale]
MSLFGLYFLLTILFGCFAVSLLSPGESQVTWKSEKSSTKSVIKSLLQSMPLIDGHNDLPMALRERYGFNLSAVNLSQRQPQFHTDIPRLMEGGIGGQFWSIFVPCRDNDLEYADIVTRTLEQIDITRRMITSYPKSFELALHPEDVIHAHKHGKIASMLGVEGGHMIDLSLPVLRMYYELGVRYLTLTHSCSTQWADSCTGSKLHNGLTSFGLSVIKEMNRLGMLVDLSHVSYDVMKQALIASEAPVIFSHSSSFTLCKVSRNVRDDIVSILVEKDGLVMVNFYTGFICGRKSDDGKRNKVTIEDVADHIMHIANIGGWEHVGLGGDFDGVDRLPEGLEDVSKYPDLLEILYERGVSAEDLKKLVGGNLLRVWKKAELVAKDLASSRPVVEEELKARK